MSWLRQDDDMLDHEKWRRAIRDGSDGVLATWFRLSSWCSRRLTDGLVPADMVDQVAELAGSKTRAKCLRALIDARLLAWCAPGEDSLAIRRGDAEPTPRARREGDDLAVVAYLKRNPSREQVTKERDRRAKAQKDYADRKKLMHQPPIGPSHLEPDDDRDTDAAPSRPVPSRPAPVDPNIDTRAIEYGATTQGPEWLQFPEGFKWSDATQAEATIAGVTAAQLQEHVNYWTLHRWSVPCTNLDGELRRCIPDIRTRAEKKRYLESTDRTNTTRSAAPVGNSYAWTPTQEHREYASANGRDVATVVPQYRAGGVPDRSPSTLATNEDFMRRLKCWVETGVFHPTGKLPPRPAPQERSQSAG